jgi:hypothetical protein
MKSNVEEAQECYGEYLRWCRNDEVDPFEVWVKKWWKKGQLKSNKEKLVEEDKKPMRCLNCGNLLKLDGRGDRSLTSRTLHCNVCDRKTIRWYKSDGQNVSKVDYDKLLEIRNV